MKDFLTFLHKEIIELIRTGKGLILLGVFVLLGMMNPFIAKLTSYVMKKMSKSLSEAGIITKMTKVTALDSWVQFYKNLPVALIIVVIAMSSLFAHEYEKGTLIPFVTKGVSKLSIFMAKEIIAFLTWTIGYWTCWLVTYFYNEYYWNNSSVTDLMLPAVCWFIFGLWVICIEMMCLATTSSSNVGLIVLIVFVVVIYFCGTFEKIKDYVPTYLTGGVSYVNAQKQLSDMNHVFVVSGISAMLFMIAGVEIFKNKRLP